MTSGDNGTRGQVRMNYNNESQFQPQHYTTRVPKNTTLHRYKAHDSINTPYIHEIHV